MSKKPAFTCLHRAILSPSDVVALVRECERTEDCVIMPGGERLDRLTFRGVPARIVDVAVPRDLPPEFPVSDGEPRRKALVLEIGRKVGRYDGAERLRLNVRQWSGYRSDGTPQQCGADGRQQPIPQGRIYFGRATDLLLVTVVWAGGSWAHEFLALRSDLHGYALGSVVWWHYRRYYEFLPVEEVRSIATEYDARGEEFSAQGLTLAEVNRMASRDLYRLARNLGWRKLTLREREAYRLDGQWHRTEAISRRRAEMGYPPLSPTGCGQYTLDAANGRAMRGPVEEDRVEEYTDNEYRTAYGLVGEDDL